MLTFAKMGPSLPRELGDRALLPSLPARELKREQTISCFGLSMILVVILRFYLQRLNRRMDQGIYEGDEALPHEEAVRHAAQLEGKSIEQIMEARRSWRYLI